MNVLTYEQNVQIYIRMNRCLNELMSRWIAAGGFGYGFFHQLNESSKLKDVEWLYRYERGLNRDLNVVMHRERLLIHGKPHEVGSLKSLIRHHEQRTGADTTFIYYYPSNK